MGDKHLYRLVIDQPATHPWTECPLCGESNAGEYVCWQCNRNLAPHTVGAGRRHWQTRGPAEKRAQLVRLHGGQAHVEQSEPVRWPA